MSGVVHLHTSTESADRIKKEDPDPCLTTALEGMRQTEKSLRLVHNPSWSTCCRILVPWRSIAGVLMIEDMNLLILCPARDTSWTTCIVCRAEVPATPMKYEGGSQEVVSTSASSQSTLAIDSPPRKIANKLPLDVYDDFARPLDSGSPCDRNAYPLLFRLLRCHDQAVTRNLSFMTVAPTPAPGHSSYYSTAPMQRFSSARRTRTQVASPAFQTQHIVCVCRLSRNPSTGPDWARVKKWRRKLLSAVYNC